MKKWIVLALSVVLLMVAAVPVFAAEQPKVTITASKTTVARGETVTFTISMTGDVPFSSVAIDLATAFDANYLEYVSSENGTYEGGALLLPYDGTSNKEILVAFTGGTGTCNGVLQKITFKVKSTAPITSTNINASASGNSGSLAVTVVGTRISVECDHTYPNGWVKVDGTYCQRVCSKCNTPEKEEHSWNEGQLITPPTCTANGKEKYTCLHCGATKEEVIGKTGHAWDNACDTTCNHNCGYTRTITHQYKTVWSSNADGHWHECQICKAKTDVSAHTPGPEATEKAAQTCTVCKYEISPKVSHVHEFGEEWIVDSEYHWHRCENRNSPCYEVIDKAEHDYDDDCDVDCNTCGYVRIPPHSYYPEWRGNAQGHWKVCSKCGAQSEIYPHSPGPEATDDTPQVCEDCNYYIQWPLSHVHSGLDVWYSDDENHWHSCGECAENLEKAAHEWDAGEVLTEPTDTQEGTKQLTCTVCGKQIISAIPINGEGDTDPSGTATVPGASAKPTNPADDSGGFPWKWAGIAAVILLVVGVGLMIFEFIRSRKVNSRGKFSK